MSSIKIQDEFLPTPKVSTDSNGWLKIEEPYKTTWYKIGSNYINVNGITWNHFDVTKPPIDLLEDEPFYCLGNAACTDAACICNFGTNYGKSDILCFINYYWHYNSTVKLKINYTISVTQFKNS